MRTYLSRLLSLSLLVMACAADESPPPTADLKRLAFAEQSAAAKELFEANRPQADPLSESWLEAMSWVGRAGAIAGDWDMAAEYAQSTLEQAERRLAEAPLGPDPQGSLAIATGAAIETLGKFYVAMNDRGQAVTYLRDKARQYGGSAIETRLNKNLLALDLAGTPMPALKADQWLGERRFEPEDLDGNVTLFFFWAHWCGDCADQEPVLSALSERYADRGLRIVAPTQLYGYLKRGSPMESGAELEHITEVRMSHGDLLDSLPVPLSGENFVSFGVSTTPTLVLVDREGVVRLYNPGFMPEAELADRIEALL
ncbi:MAG: TlpA disulfide reductase family protein [Bryobacterales bacterium]|nr:TlpA disulfide reductase family protein [Bryobacterales bacterium]